MIEDNYNFKVISVAFPHIGKKLALFWGEPEFNTLMASLQQDDRSGNRAGFPADVLMALHSLAAAHDAEFPALARVELDFWNQSKAR